MSDIIGLRKAAIKALEALANALNNDYDSLQSEQDDSESEHDEWEESEDEPEVIDNGEALERLSTWQSVVEDAINDLQEVGANE